MFKTVVFDIDGTLVDSNDSHAHAWVRALEERGHHVAFEEVRPLIGMGSDKLLPAVAGINAASPEGEAIGRRQSDIFRTEYLPRLQPTRGAKRLVEWLRDENLTLVVATSANAREVQDLLEAAGVAKSFQAETSSDDAEESKPDPDVVHAALARVGCDPIDAVMIGDTPYDIEAALRAGVGVIALRCGGWWSDENLADAVAIYDDPDDLLQQFELSPFKRPLPAFFSRRPNRRAGRRAVRARESRRPAGPALRTVGMVAASAAAAGWALRVILRNR